MWYTCVEVHARVRKPVVDGMRGSRLCDKLRVAGHARLRRFQVDSGARGFLLTRSQHLWQFFMMMKNIVGIICVPILMIMG